jgi:hypothetical protein
VLKNVTLNAEEKLIEAARARAQQERTTLNSLFREWLARYAGRGTTPNRYDQLMRELRHIKVGRKFSREELNER